MLIAAKHDQMRKPSAEERREVERLISESLRRQGFRVRQKKVFPPEKLDKETLRNLHSLSVQHRIEQARPRLSRHESRLLDFVASGQQVNPDLIAPRLVEVQPNSDYELLFRYCSLHWSIPVSSGYGRRLRFLVFDAQNDKIMGLFGLCDPVFSLADRDAWIGWTFEQRKKRLKHVMEAFILGAVPPYSQLLCGKLMTMMCGSDEVRMAFKKKYGQGHSLISHQKADGRLALITTTSALGKSSIYNRLRYGERRLVVPVGFTSGWGEFHFSNGAYARLRDFAETYCDPTAKRQTWGKGFRNRREVVRKCLSHLGLSDRMLNHGIKRQLFAMPLANNAREFLRGEHERLCWKHQAINDLFDYFRDRWLLPRARRDLKFARFERDSYRLW